MINIEKGRLEGHFNASFKASEAVPRLVKVEAGIKANVVPGKAKAVVEGVDLGTLEGTAREVEAETGVSFGCEGNFPVIQITAQGDGAHASTPQEGRPLFTAPTMHL